ncbi:MAG: hemolysin III family protein [bacterium]|nr:hemolysin III family protein [bacterium]
MTTATLTPRYSVGEEIANSVTHGVGIVLAIAGLGLLTAFASLRGDVWHIVACSVFGTTLVLLYTASTLYHSIQRPRAKRVLRVLDHSAIFLLIAGTYTPFTLVSIRGAWGWSLFGIIWALAVAGIIIQATPLRRWQAVGLVLYIVMGWAAAAFFKPMIQSVAPGGLVLLLAGGLAYTGGIGFYAWHRLPYAHAIWHGFVLLGSVLHFFAVLLYVIPAAG